MSNKILLRNVFTNLLKEISPEKLIERSCVYESGSEELKIFESSYNLSNYKNVHILGSGKAVIPMACAMQTLLKERITSSLLVGAYALEAPLPKTTYLQSTHPIPSEISLEAAHALQDKLQSLHQDDFFIYLLSGGTSALVELPVNEISLKDFQETTLQMLHGGMPIEAINAVRKHISQVKGGKLALQTSAQGVVLVLSDVIGDDLHAIGSAPFYYDTTSFLDAISSLKHYKVFEKIPKDICDYLEAGVRNEVEETPKSTSSHIEHFIIGSNALVLQKSQKLLSQSNCKSSIISTPIEGDVAKVADQLYNFALEHQEQRHCYIFGGEATVIVNGAGKGGRNQHLCLHLLTKLIGKCDLTVLCAATDGVDGNSTAAGAIIDWHSRIDALSHNIDPAHYLQEYNSNTFFTKTDALLEPGATDNNLLDIIIMLIEPPYVPVHNQGDNNG